MIKKLNKKVAFSTSLILSSLLGIIFANTKGSTVSTALLDTPILSIEKVSASDGGGGDCSCSSCDTVSYPPSASGATIWITVP